MDKKELLIQDIKGLEKIRNDISINIDNLKEEQKSIISNIGIEKNNQVKSLKKRIKKLEKEIEDLESLKGIKLTENSNIMSGQEKLYKMTEKMKKEKVDIEKKLKKIKLILSGKEQDEEIWLYRISELKTKYIENVKKVYEINNEIKKTNKLSDKVNLKLKQIQEKIDTLDKVKFVISELKEINKQMFDEMQDVYKRANVNFPYSGSYEKYIADKLGKKLDENYE